jgi:hypothetical protein
VVPYRHTQFGWVLAGALVLGVLVAAGVTLLLPEGAMRAPWWTPLLLVGLLAFSLALFGWLTVEVDAREVRLSLGVGALRKTVPVAEIVTCQRIRTRLWWGWGLRWTPAGWLYNVSGREAVRLELARERPVIIGSDDADALKTAIDASVSACDRSGRAGRTT